MKKKILSILAAVCMAFVSASALPISRLSDDTGITASALTSGNYEYSIRYDGTAEITKYKGTNQNVIIVSTLGGKKVTSIGYRAFAGCTNMIVATIPDTVTTISNQAFEGCTSLKTVKMPESVTSIGAYAFCDCTKIYGMTIPKSVSAIGTMAFHGCSGMKSITVDPANKYYSASEGILYNKNKTEVICCTPGKAGATLPTSVKTIKDSAFCDCKSLKAVAIPGSVTKIESYAFEGCPNLKSLTIPRSVTSIGSDALGYVYDSSRSKVSGFTIVCSNSSAALSYAKSNGFKYTLLPADVRLSGSNRYATAAKISGSGFSNAECVVLASGKSFADALAGVPLAYVNNAPILLTDTDSLPTATANEIKRIAPKEIIILGGTAAVGSKVEEALGKLGYKGNSVKRIYGSKKTATAVNIAKELSKKTQADPLDIFFASSGSFADALSVSTVASIKNAPIIYLPKDGSIDSETLTYLQSVKGKVVNAYVIGGDGAISDSVMKAAAKALGLAVNAGVTRVSGSNRYATCLNINKKFKSVLKGTAVCAAKGSDFPDALAGGVFAASKNAPMMLVGNSLSDEQKSFVKSHGAKTLYIFGGNSAVSELVAFDIVSAMR